MGTIAETLIKQGVEKGQQEGALALRTGILKVLTVRFPLSAKQSEMLTQRLEKVSSLTRLDELHTHALQAASVEEFERRLD